MRPIGHLARVVAETTLAQGELAGLRVKLVADAGAALLALLVATTLSVYKPQGMTPYGRCKQSEAGHIGAGSANGTPWWLYVFGTLVVVLILLFVITHATGVHHH